MFEFLLFSRPVRTVRNRDSRRLAVELLEDRTCPSGITFDALVLPEHQVQLSGVLTGEYAAGAIVEFSGAVYGTAIADTNGRYIFTTEWATQGTVYAVGLHEGQAFTLTAASVIDVAAPTVTLSITDMTEGTVTLSGMLTDIDFAGQTISISGASICSVTTDAQGFFTFTLDRANLEMVEVSETDLWGETSNVASVDVANAAPFIREFTAVKSLDGVTWTFRGNVIGTDVQGLVVDLGGFAQLNGETATVDATGWFTFAKILAAGTTGTATAQTTTVSGAESNIAYAEVA